MINMIVIMIVIMIIMIITITIIIFIVTLFIHPGQSAAHRISFFVIW